MKLWALVMLFLTTFSQAYAGTTLSNTQRVQKSQSWDDFQSAMEKLRRDDEQRGTSYIISGTIVTIGSLLAVQYTQDAATKLIYGISSSAGIAAITYGFANIYFGNNYNSFYESVKETGLSDAQRNSLVKNFLAYEQERRDKIKRMQMIAHYLAGAINIYSASIEKDSNAKTFFSALAGINFALGLSFTF